MNTYICILGRQPAIGLVELESRFGPETLTPLAPGFVQLETDADINTFQHFGSLLKVGILRTTLDNSDWNKTLRYLQKSLPHHLHHLPDGKVTLGLSIYGLNVPPAQVNAAALSLKKTIKQSGRSARIVPNAEPALNTAQVIHNKLTSPNGIELMLIKTGNQLVLAQTVWVQDIEAYRQRDQERPMRDARVGMLPPKLAQIIINLADPADESTVLDPFCGTGVVLQETLLMGLQAAGSDVDPRMVEYTNKNLAWLGDNHPTAIVADATTHKWSQTPESIACETYLGRALSSMPDQESLQKIIRDCDTIHAKFLRNVTRQTQPGFKMALAVPAWHTKNGFKHMPVLDHLEELGYNRIKFVHARTEDLIYHREGQIVARELVVLTRK